MSDPLELAMGGLGGLGSLAQTPAGAAARPWAPAGAAGPILVDLSKPVGDFAVSVLDGGLLRVEVRPANQETYLELSKLPTRVQRQGAFGVSFWDLPGVQSIASQLRYDVVLYPDVQAMVDRWTRWCLELEYVKNFAQFPDFHVPGLDIDFLDFQSRGVNYGTKIKSFLLGDQMGCIDGEAVINVNRAGIGKRHKLSDAYKRFHGLDRKNWNWDHEIPTYCRALCDGELRQHRVIDILDKGIKPVVRIEFASGKNLRLTPDHEIMTKSSGWKEAALLRPGETIVSSGEVLFTPKEDIVVLVVPDGESHVYDVVMDTPHHNFVANGIVVHNCGKSIIALGILFANRQSLGGRIETMILSPTSVVGDWHAKFRRFAKIEIAVADGSPGRRLKVYESRPEFMAISYDTFSRDAARIINSFQPKAIVPDECQRITNRKSKATQNLIDFVDIVQPRFKIPISGSPIANRPDDLWPIFRMINPGLAGPAKSFENRYLKQKPIWMRGPDGKPMVKKIEYGTGEKKKVFIPMRTESLDPRKPEEAKVLDELKMKIAPYVIRRLKKDVLKDLPDKMFERIDIVLSKREREVYEELQARFAEAMAGVIDEDVDGQATTFLQWFTRAQQICSSLEITGDGAQSSKIDELKEFVQDYAEDQKILIFSRFKEMTKIVCRELKAYKPLHLNGDVQQSKRQPLVDLFQDDESHRLFVSTLKAGGVGLTLTAGSIVIRLDRWVSPSANDQAVDRAHRIGQSKQVTVVDFVVADSIEERILEMLDKKLRMIASLISADDDEEKQERKIVRALLRKKDMMCLI